MGKQTTKGRLTTASSDTDFALFLSLAHYYYVVRRKRENMPKIQAEDIAEVRRMVAAKEYDKARKHLKRFDDPWAQKALIKLNQTHPETKSQVRPANSQRILLGGVFVAIALALIAVAGVAISLKRQNDFYQPLSDMFAATPPPTWTPPYSSPVEAMAWMCHSQFDDQGLSESALTQACQKEAELFYEKNKAKVDACYTGNQNDFLRCAIDGSLFLDGQYIEAAK